jgi:cytochrome c oxidase cbb3-type subunit 3
MSDDKKVPDTGHDYDGIREHDNMLPRWWLASFYITMVFAVVYYAYYEVGNGASIKDEFAGDLAAIEAARHAATAGKPFPDADKLGAAEKSPESVAKGRGVFQARCVSCHGERAQGLIGPNLTDAYWLHGDGKTGSIAAIVNSGVPEKGMPPWGPLLSEEEVYAVAVYVRSLKGSNPPGAKAPQGQLVKE